MIPNLKNISACAVLLSSLLLLVGNPDYATGCGSLTNNRPYGTCVPSPLVVLNSFRWEQDQEPKSEKDKDQQSQPEKQSTEGSEQPRPAADSKLNNAKPENSSKQQISPQLEAQDQPQDQDQSEEKIEPPREPSPEPSPKPEKESGGEDLTQGRLSFPFSRLARDEFKENSKRAKVITELFKPLVVSAEASTVKILNGNRTVSLGTVVAREGLILTKASELRGELKCGLIDGRKVEAVVLGVHPETDLALLRIDVNDLQPIHWGQEPMPVVGQWIASPMLDSNEVQVGIIGVNARKIPPSTPYLGIGPALNSTEEIVGAKIDTVQPGTPADDADLMVGDIISGIDEVEIKNWDELRKTLGQYDPKDEVTLTVRRGKEELKIKVVLGDREKLTAGGGTIPGQDRSTMQNNMGSRPSQRRKDFPNAFQHDLMLNRFTCGGPVVNLNGQVVGINIARAGRVDSLALPVSTVLPVLEQLKSGKLAPSVVHEARLTELEKELQELRTKMTAIPATGNLENQLMIEKARQEELDRAKKEMQKTIEELENRIKVVEMKKNNFEKELKSIKLERNRLDRRTQSLEREKKNLSSGVN